MVGGSTVLKNFVYEHLDDTVKDKVTRCIGFPDAAVDRIVPMGRTMDFTLVWDGVDLIRTMSRAVQVI